MRFSLAADRREHSQALAVVSVSGGKDSMATAVLARDKCGLDNCRFVFADTGNEHELTCEYVNVYLPTVLGPIVTVRADFSREIANKRIYAQEVWPTKGVPNEIVQRALSVLHPTGVPFLDMCLWKGRFPSRMTQFCTQYLKRTPLDNYLLDQMEGDREIQSWRGIRRDESSNRSNALDRELVAEGYWIVQPIVTWTAQQVVDFVIGRGIKLNPLYSQGMHRVGCMPCINSSKDDLLETSKRFSPHIDKIREWERLVSLAAKRGWTTFFADCLRDGETDAEIFQRMQVDERVRWAQTARGGRQMDFIRQGAPQVCSSVYGLCE
jgi:3'-phosphoadenosine 5'-phosphosulfate sulfotransferase (PAPS reductase)/FAD synthetase